MTAHSVFNVASPATAARTTHFRPARYQTKEELDRFFGTTGVQKREQRLRVRESDGHVFFDWIEKDEWQHLLATGSLTSPSTPSNAPERRRSSVATCLTLNSPLCPASPGRRTSLASSTRSASMSPLVGRFGDVQFGARAETFGPGGYERRGRKRSNSALARSNGRVDDQVHFRPGTVEAKNWTTTPGSKRRQSETLVLTWHHGYYAGEQPDSVERAGKQDEGDKIHIPRLPLTHRKLDQEMLDQAFGSHDSRLNRSSDIPLHQPCARASKPLTLQISSGAQRCDSIELEEATSSTCSSPATSPIAVDKDGTFSSASGGRRGTFGLLLPTLQQQEQSAVQTQVPSIAQGHVCDKSDSARSPPSAAMEVLQTPPSSHFATSISPRAAGVARGLRHARSFDALVTHQDTLSQETCKASPTWLAPETWAQHQAWHFADYAPPSFVNKALQAGGEHKLRAVRSIATLCDSHTPVFGYPSQRAGHAVKMESDRTVGCLGGCSELDAVWTTPLAPRTGAKKFDRTRMQLLTTTSLASASPATSSRSLPDTVTVAAEATNPIRMGVGLRTGPEVYHGIDIPCAAIHLHSDPEDNVEPALAQSMSASKLKKLRKKTHTPTHTPLAPGGNTRVCEVPNHARCTSIASSSAGGVAGQSKTGLRWWSHILHN